MKIIQTTDHHLKDEEPFYQAGIALNKWLVERLNKEQEPFVYVNSGDMFHMPKETGRVNGNVVQTLLAIGDIPNCKEIILLQGNHDYRADMGCALDCFNDLAKVTIIKEPTIKEIGDKLIYFMPHMKPRAVDYYKNKSSYGEIDFHINYWKDLGKDFNEINNKLDICIAHIGDSTSGIYNQDADISFIKGIHSHGHIHKFVSMSHLPSASITRRDEIDKACILREFNLSSNIEVSFKDIEIPKFLNYMTVPYGEYPTNFKAKTSLILDIEDYDDESLAIKEYTERYANSSSPKVYIGKVIRQERQIKSENTITDNLSVENANLEKLLKEYFVENKTHKRIQDKLLKRIVS